MAAPVTPLESAITRRWFGKLTGLGAVGLLSACTGNQAPPRQEAPLQRVAPRSDSMSPPDSSLRQGLNAGTEVEPVTGLRLVVGEGAAALTPESLGEGRASVTYIWQDPKEWGYLVAEGPVSFPLDQLTAEKAANQDRQELIGAGVKPTVPERISWAGYTEAFVLAWNQWTLPPGWPNSTSIDAIQLLLVNEAGNSYRVVAYGARDSLGPKNPAWRALCSIGAEALEPTESPSPSPEPEEGGETPAPSEVPQVPLPEDQ